MKKLKCALGLVALLASVSALSACDLATASDTGSVFTYTDAQGNRVSYTAEDLLNDYRKTGSSLSTEFDKVFEVLVRHYYDDESQATTYKTLEAKATQDVIDDKQTAVTNASNNSTSFETEFEKILTNASCDNADDLYQYHLYQEEKSAFEDGLYQTFNTGDTDVNGLEAMRDGEYTSGTTTEEAFPASTWGIGTGGWLDEQMPYHIRHILVKLSSGKSNEYTRDIIGESSTVGEGGETTKLANDMMLLAGAQTVNGKLAANDTNRWSFGQIALNYSDDSDSATNFGETSLMTKVMSSGDLVNEFKLGTYAFETLYDKRESANTNAYRLMPGLAEDATSASDVDDDLTLMDSGTTVNTFFKDEGVGQIPFGAALALLDNATVTKDSTGSTSYTNYYPRNIIYNKYFNKHNICVITPNAIQMNATSSEADDNTVAAANNAKTTTSNGKIVSENDNGIYSTQFGELPGFQVDTTNVLPSFTHNVLTDSEGQIVLAVRAGTSSYQGIHFITVERSPLDEYGLIKTETGDQYVAATESDVKSSNEYITDSPSLSDYYTIYTPNSEKYPTYGTTQMTTYDNYNKQQTSDWTTRSNTLVTDIKGYNSCLSTYEFQMLFDEGAIKFDNSDLEEEIKRYTTDKRLSAKDDAFTTWSDNWRTYAEQIDAQEEARENGEASDEDLLSEVCAVGYGNYSDSDPLWQLGGACYHVTK